VRAGLAVVVPAGLAEAADPWFSMNSVAGTTRIPITTVTTNATAPHSRRTKDQFTNPGF
jgi:hypothetical protein